MPLESAALQHPPHPFPETGNPLEFLPFLWGTLGNFGSTWEFSSLSLCLAFREAAGAGKGSAAKAGAAGGTHCPETNS